MHLIFDFDGTLIDSFDSAIHTLNHLADEFSFRKIAQDEISQLKELSSHEFVKFLNIPFYKIPTILLKARKRMQDEIITLSPFAHIPETLQKLHDKKIVMGILTSNSVKNVTAWLKINNMQNLFHFIHSESNYFGKSHLLEKIIRQYKIDKSQAFYIGDETRDIEAAKQSGLYSLAVTWGFNIEKVLARHAPHHIARKPEDLLNIFTGRGQKTSTAEKDNK